jgi:hypothetical protein
MLDIFSAERLIAIGEDELNASLAVVLAVIPYPMIGPPDEYDVPNVVRFPTVYASTNMVLPVVAVAEPALTMPATSSFCAGFVVPMPTFPPAVARYVPPVTVSPVEDAFASVVCPATPRVPVIFTLPNVAPSALKLVVDAFVEKSEASVAPAAERFVVEALVMNALVNVSPVPEIPVVEAFASVV